MIPTPSTHGARLPERVGFRIAPARVEPSAVSLGELDRHLLGHLSWRTEEPNTATATSWRQSPACQAGLDLPM